MLVASIEGCDWAHVSSMALKDQNQKEVNLNERRNPSEVPGMCDHLRLRQYDSHSFHEAGDSR